MRLCQFTDSINPAHMCTIMTTVLQLYHSHTKLIFWAPLAYGKVRLVHSSILTVCDNAGRNKERAWYEKEVFVQQEYYSPIRTDRTKYVGCILHIYCIINKYTLQKYKYTLYKCAYICIYIYIYIQTHIHPIVPSGPQVVQSHNIQDEAVNPLTPTKIRCLKWKFCTKFV